MNDNITYTDYIEIGSAPSDEECAQVGEEGYSERAKKECGMFIDLIREAVGPEPAGAKLCTKMNNHDFGFYFEVVCRFDRNNEMAVDYAFRCEREAPARWAKPKGNKPNLA